MNAAGPGPEPGHLHVSVGSADQLAASSQTTSVISLATM
jgi:hypothetical protein